MKKLIFILISIACLYLFRSDILKSYAELFYIDNAAKGADMILILAGNPSTRVPYALNLYKKGYGDKIAYTQTKTNSRYKDIFLSQSAQVEKVLKIENIDPVMITSQKNGATSTFDEAYDLAYHISQNDIKHIILVTDRFHTRRAYYAFQKIFDKFGINIKLQIAGAPNDIFNESNWYKSEYGISMYILEPVKFIVYMLLDHNYPHIQES